MDAERFDEIHKKRARWPFRNMSVGDVIEVTGMNGKTSEYICIYAHNYGNMSGKKFHTLIHEGRQYVKRIA